jgi:hypothetical protein
MTHVRLECSHALFEDLHHKAERARTNVKVPKRLLVRLLIDNLRLHDAAQRAGVKITEGDTTGEAA